MKKIFILLLLSYCCHLFGDLSLIPVSHKGRIRPLRVYAEAIFNELYHSSAIEQKDAAFFPSKDPLEIILKLYVDGYEKWADVPMIWVESSKSRLSYNALKNADPSSQKLALLESFQGWQKDRPLRDDPHFHLLPGKYAKGEWFGLNALLSNDRNFTLYPEASFQNLRESYLAWLKDNNVNLGEAFLQSYQEIAGKPFLKSANNQSYYPNLLQLQLELLYTSWPIVQLSIVGYLLALFLLLAFPEKKVILNIGVFFFGCAFLLQLSSLLLRSYILMRPPVSNMFETVIYVPFVSAIVAMVLSKKMQSYLPLAASALLSAILLALIEISDLHRGLENVQAVLNSNFWLATHVLMIVGSYGILILAGVLSHFYLIALWRKFKEIQVLEKSIVQSLYLGTALLIPGTILGGVWAAQSWGRFWDWDPKESWAFISICTYLILIHLYRFNKISIKGLSFGAIIGLSVISFTWYGVNYILGTGMHTYGFGSGSHVYYFIFLLAESFFLIYMALRLQNFLCKTPLGYIKD